MIRTLLTRRRVLQTTAATALAAPFVCSHDMMGCALGTSRTFGVL